MREYILAIVAVLLLVPTLGYGQSRFLDKGQGGVGISFAVSDIQRRASDGTTFSIGASSAGIFDIGYARNKVGRTSSNGLFASYFVSKAGRFDDPVSVSLDFAYEWSSVTRDWYMGGGTRSVGYFTVGASVYLDAALGSHSFVQPAAGVGLSKSVNGGGKEIVHAQASVHLALASTSKFRFIVGVSAAATYLDSDSANILSAEFGVVFGG